MAWRKAGQPDRVMVVDVDCTCLTSKERSEEILPGRNTLEIMNHCRKCLVYGG